MACGVIDLEREEKELLAGVDPATRPKSPKASPVTMAEVLRDLYMDPTIRAAHLNILVFTIWAVVCPMTSVDCERGFSFLKLLLGPLRSTLTGENLDYLMRVGLLGPRPREAVEDFLVGVFNRWLRQKPRRLAFPSTVVDEASVARKERLAKKREAEAKRHKMNKVKKSLRMQRASSSSSSSSSSSAAAAEPEQDEQNEEQAEDYGWHDDQLEDDSLDSNMVGPNDMEDDNSQ